MPALILAALGDFANASTAAFMASQRVTPGETSRPIETERSIMMNRSTSTASASRESPVHACSPPAPAALAPAALAPPALAPLAPAALAPPALAPPALAPPALAPLAPPV